MVDRVAIVGGVSFGLPILPKLLWHPFLSLVISPNFLEKWRRSGKGGSP